MQEVVHLLLDKASVRAEGIGIQTPFDEFLLFHESLVWDSVHHVVAEDGRGQMLIANVNGRSWTSCQGWAYRISILGVEDSRFTTENKVVSLRAEQDGDLAAK